VVFEEILDIDGQITIKKAWKQIND
jgi:hypothetical protein